jgi:tetratricopeptide (TPR) repeat protein/transcriptional regulator with XRE-family HTH domain
VKGVRAVAEQVSVTFGSLLRQLRDDAFLTQEELANAAGLGPRSVSDLERGVSRTARLESARLLADALGLAGEARALFLAAARGRAEPATVLAASHGSRSGPFAAATRTLPRAIGSFTGRTSELADLERAVTENTAGGAVVGIHAIGGMAGVGKTAFAVHAAHALAPRFPDGQYFLPLHAHTVGQRPVEPEDALASLLTAAGVPAQQIPRGAETRAARWRDVVAGRRILLLLDDATGHRQVRPLLPGSPGSLVLITSRRRLTALSDATVLSLEALPPGDAAVLLARLANRPDARPDDVAVTELARLCGYLPLAVGMVASQLRHHPAREPAGLAAELAAASSRLAAMRAEDLSVAAAFELSYADLDPDHQRLFRLLGLVPGPSVDVYAASALADIGLDTARRLLDQLYDQHMVTEPATGRYVLHDLLREFSHALAGAADRAESDAATTRLLDYYLQTAVAANRHIPAMASPDPKPLTPPPAHQPDLPTLAEAARWLDTERPNLYAAADYAATTDRTQHAVQIPAALGEFLRGHGDWAQSAALHKTALNAARQAHDKPAQALALRQIGIVTWLSGNFPDATTSLTEAADLYAQVGDQANHAYTLDQLGMVQQLAGDYAASLASRQRALAQARRSGSRRAEAIALNHLGRIQLATGDHFAALVNLHQAVQICRALDFHMGEADAVGILGLLQRDTGDYAAAADSQRRCLALFRALDHRPFIATGLNELGLLHQLTGDYPAASAWHQQALVMNRELGYRYAEAETLNSLGELSTRTLATRQARDQHAKALAIARDIGLPLEEGRALQGIGTSYLRDGNIDDGLNYLRQALAINRRIGAPAAQRVQQAIDEQALRSGTS